MLKHDVANLKTFNSKMRMYIPEETRETVVSFLHGYELASGCVFTQLLNQYLADHYNVRGSAMGWPWKVEQLHKMDPKMSWVDMYLKVATEVLDQNA